MPDPRGLGGVDGLGRLLGVLPTPATHAILAQLKAGETVYQAGELPKTLRVSQIDYEPPKTVCKTTFASIFPPSMENGYGARHHYFETATEVQLVLELALGGQLYRSAGGAAVRGSEFGRAPSFEVRGAPESKRSCNQHMQESHGWLTAT